MKTEREKRNGVPQASCPVGMNVKLFFGLFSLLNMTKKPTSLNMF